MEQALMTFEYHKMKVRTVETESGEIFWVAKDVCEALDIRNYRDAVARLDDEQKGVGTTDTLGGEQQTLIIDESGLYTLIFQSRKPQAKAFQKWVTKEVLPTLRKTGCYRLPDDMLKTLDKYEEFSTVGRQAIDALQDLTETMDNEIGRLRETLYAAQKERDEFRRKIKPRKKQRKQGR